MLLHCCDLHIGSGTGEGKPLAGRVGKGMLLPTFTLSVQSIITIFAGTASFAAMVVWSRSRQHDGSRRFSGRPQGVAIVEAVRLHLQPCCPAQ